jgi:MFS family permease
MGTVVWASTAGAVGGPFLLEPAQAVATSAGLPALSGPFLLAVVAAFSALLAASRIRPQRAVVVDQAPDSEPSAPRTPVVAAGVMLVGHLVMVAMTTSVPVHAHHQGKSLGALGLMLSFHTLGMFALSPVTGWWIDRAGPRPVMLAGLVTVMVSATAMTLSGAMFTVVLFLLGYGWNLCYLGGSASLRRSAVSPAAASRLESRAEAWVWTVAALATAASTGLFAEGGFRLLSTASVVLALPLLVVVARRRTVRTVAPEPECVRG